MRLPRTMGPLPRRRRPLRHPALGRATRGDFSEHFFDVVDARCRINVCGRFALDDVVQARREVVRECPDLVCALSPRGDEHAPVYYRVSNDALYGIVRV